MEVSHDNQTQATVLLGRIIVDKVGQVDQNRGFENEWKTFDDARSYTRLDLIEIVL